MLLLRSRSILYPSWGEQANTQTTVATTPCTQEWTRDTLALCKAQCPGSVYDCVAECIAVQASRRCTPVYYERAPPKEEPESVLEDPVPEDAETLEDVETLETEGVLRLEDRE